MLQAMIVTNRAKPRKRAARKPAQPALIAKVVTQPSKYDRIRRKMAELAPDPEAEARVAAFLARVIRPRES